MDTPPIRVLLTDDHAIVRKGVRALLATERDIQVIGEAGDVDNRVYAILQQVPDGDDEVILEHMRGS